MEASREDVIVIFQWVKNKFTVSFVLGTLVAVKQMV